MYDIENFYDKQIDFLDERTKLIIKNFIEKMDNKNSEYYDNKMKDIKIVIYNNRDKVSMEVTQDLEVIV